MGDEPATFTIRREPPLFAPRERQKPPGAATPPLWRRHLRKWWRALATAAFAVWVGVSIWSAVATVDDESQLRPSEARSVADRATCYSANNVKYEDCVRFRQENRNTGGRTLRLPMLTPYRVSLCATLQDPFSAKEFWGCVKALSDPRQ